MTEYYLWLLQLMGVANPKIHQLIQRYGSPKNVYEAIALGKDTRFLTQSEINRLSSATMENSARIIEECGKERVDIITLDDPDYPYKLSQIDNPPVLLFCKGTLKGINDEICISGVGARGATAYTAKITRRTCMDLSKLGVVLISGMAAGVDHLVHQSALDAGGKTVGILACGLKADYPKGSIPTRERIYQLGGACISELLPYAQPSRLYFRARNRIISGLSLGTMVFQAGMNSGSLITAEHALQQGRDLFCVPPHDLFDYNYCGVVKYLREGAIPLFNYLDVVNTYFSLFEDKLNSINKKYKISPNKQFAFSKIEELSQKPKHNHKDNRENSLKSKNSHSEQGEIKKRKGELKAESFDFESRKPEYKIIYDFLNEYGKQQIEVITDSCNISASDISEYLMDLEVEGIITSFAGDHYAISE